MATSPSPRSSPALKPVKPVSPPLEPPKKSPFVPSWRRPTLIQPGSTGGRRPSVQFIPQTTTDGANSRPQSRSSSAQPSGSRVERPPLAEPGGAGRRLSSPPPPAQFRSSVSFDTFNNKEASDFSLTLNRKHRDYSYTKRSRTFLCGTDTNDYSDTALEWLIDELVDDGDEVVCLRVVEKDSKEALKWSGGLGERGYRNEAERFLDGIERKNTEDRAISLILEFSIGRVQETIQQMIRIYEPAMLVVGTRGRSLTGYHGLLSSGSVSKYCLQYSPVPVIVVRPSSKREAKKKKRLNDPDRMGYRDILDKSEDAQRGRGGHLLDAQNRRSVVGANYGALGELGSAAGDPDREARMVAEAIGYKAPPPRASTPLGTRRESSLSRTTTADSGRSRRESSLSRSTTGDSNRGRRESSLSRVKSDDSETVGALLKSPDSQTMDSPEVSDEEADEGDDEEFVRPEDEAARLAYERALQTMEEEQEEADARAKRDAERNVSRGRPTGIRGSSRSRSGVREGREDGRGAAVLGMLEQLDKGGR